MTKCKKRRQKQRARATPLTKKKKCVMKARCSSTPPPKTPVSPCSQSRSFCFSRSAFPSITAAAMPLMTTGLCLYRWCQNLIAQIFRTVQQLVFPCHVCRQELNVLRERVEKLEAELARLPSMVQNGTVTAFSEKSPCRRSEKLALTISAHTELSFAEPVSLPPPLVPPAPPPPPPPPPPLPPPPPPLVPLSFKRKEGAKTQAVLLKKDIPMQITLKDLLNVKLKKTHSCTVIDKKGSPFHKPRATITVSDLQGVNLKSKASQPPARVANPLITPSKTHLDFRKHLKKVAIQRSPGGTPLTNKENIETGTGLTPIMTQALRRKFQLAHPKSPSPSQLLRGSSFEEQS